MTDEVKAAKPEDCLAGGGEMGALMRSLDWSAILLGPVSSWPQIATHLRQLAKGFKGKQILEFLKQY